MNSVLSAGLPGKRDYLGNFHQGSPVTILGGGGGGALARLTDYRKVDFC